MQNRCPGIRFTYPNWGEYPTHYSIIFVKFCAFDTVMSHALAPQASMNRASPGREIGIAVGNAGLTRG